MKLVEKIIIVGSLITVMLATIAACVTIFTKQLYNHFIPAAIILFLVLLVIDHKYPETKEVGE